MSTSTHSIFRYKPGEHPDQNKHTLEKNYRKELIQKFKTSLILHVIIFSVLFIRSLFFHSEPIVFTPSIQVDLIGLPDLTMKEMAEIKPNDSVEDLSKKLAKAEKSSEKIIEEIKSTPNEMVHKEKVEKKSSSKDLKRAIERIKALEAIEEKPSSKKITLKGNVVSKGNSLTGEQNESISEFGDKIRNKLSQNWDLPVWLSKQNLSAQVAMYLDKSGFVTKTVFLKSSGNDQFDQYVLKTIKLSQPFGPPPEIILESGVKLGFPL